MVVTQTRLRLGLLFIPGSAFIVGLGGLGLWASATLILSGRQNWVMLAATLLVAAVGVSVAVVGAFALTKPARLITSREGFTFESLRGPRTWNWSDVSNFRRFAGPHGGTVGGCLRLPRA